MPPRSKNGSTISSHVSASTLEGGGSVAPVLRHSISQITRNTASTTTGGTTFVATIFDLAVRRAASGVFFGASANTLAGAAEGNGTAVVSVLSTGMFISVSLQWK